MFVKLGNSYTISILVTDINGVRITNDSPYAIIKNISQNTYWNGITWVESEFQIYLEHVLNGVYQYAFTPDTTDIFELVTKSDAYQISKTDTLEVYDNDFVTYQWMVGNEFMIKYPLSDINVIPTVKICKEISNMYWNGAAWSTEPVHINMTVIEGGISTYIFIPDEESNYYITIFDGIDEMLIAIQATKIADNIAPIIVTNKSLKSLDGTDCTIMNESGITLSAVKILVYDLFTKQIISQTVSDTNGSWSLILKPGKYYFTFEKDGYIPIGMQRTVN